MLPQATIEAANAEILRVFEQTSVAWRTLPHWQVGDPAAQVVPIDRVQASGPPVESSAVAVTSLHETFTLHHSQAADPRGDTIVLAAREVARRQAQAFDAGVVVTLLQESTVIPVARTTAGLVGGAGDTTAHLQQVGFRGNPSLWASSDWFAFLHQLAAPRNNRLNGELVERTLRTASIDRIETGGEDTAFVIGNGHGSGAAALAASPADVAVTVVPSMQVVGSGAAGSVECSFRFAFAIRVRDASGIVRWEDPTDATFAHHLRQAADEALRRAELAETAADEARVAAERAREAHDAAEQAALNAENATAALLTANESEGEGAEGI